MTKDDRPDLERDMRQLLQVTKVISSFLLLEEQLPVILDAAIQLTRADKAILFLYNDRGELEIKDQLPQAETGKEGKFSRSIVDQVLKTGVPEFILDTDLNSRLKSSESVRAYQLRTVMCAPLQSKSGLLGVLYVHSNTPMRAFDEHKREIFIALCDHTAIALLNARLYAASISDPMTGLYNHAYCIRRLAEEVDRARRYERYLSFFLIDIDGFKQVNDTFGHRKGDAVICAVAETLQQTLRKSDIAARYGGDEFALILPEIGAPGAKVSDIGQNGITVLAERLRENIETIAFDGFKITASIGVAVYPTPGIQKAESVSLFEDADRAMYAAKQAGRNRVTFASTR